MPRIAILGANGQVGAELCLLFSKIPGIDLVPVCRNPTGSAFLRYSGIACRHGRIAQAREARSLIGDCDVIVNCTLGTGTPHDIRAFDRAMLGNVFAHSPPGAIIIHCSTLMVHGDPRPDRMIRRRDAYGRAKATAERFVRRESRRTGKRAFSLRLGHVCGPLQNITHDIRSEITGGRAALYERDRPSNTVYTVTIVDAIRSIIAGNERPGEYDLCNFPQWTWAEVYQFESKRCNLDFVPRSVPEPTHEGTMSSLIAAARGSAARSSRSPAVRRSLDRWLSLAPAALNARAQAVWYTLRARAEIAALARRDGPSAEKSWVDLCRRTLVSLQPTAALLADDPYSSLGADIKKRWPRHLELSVAEQAEVVEQPSAV
jgi:nucleoside-diphosphate-sugar epimerase